MGVHYENGNTNNPVVVIGDDPTNEDNVLVSRLATPVSVPKTSVSDSEGTDEEGNAANNLAASKTDQQPENEGGENAED